MNDRIQNHYEDSRNSIINKTKSNPAGQSEAYLIEELSKMNSYLLSENLNHEYRKFYVDNFIKGQK